MLTKAGADLASVSDHIDTSTAMGRAMFAMVSVFARLESDLTGERVAAANAEQVRRDGFRASGVQPYGWALDAGKRVAVPEEQAVIASIIAQRRGGACFREIAERLNADGVPSMYRRRGYTRFGPNDWCIGTLSHLVARIAPELSNLKINRPRFIWTEEARALIGTMPDARLATQLGCTRITVYRERVRRGVPPFGGPK